MSDAEGVRPGTIAVIGLAGRFPGARSPQDLWTIVRQGVDAITFFTDEQLIAAGVAPDALHDPAYVKANGRLADIEQFDAAFFGMSPRDAAIFDPQHRFFLECAWEAFEHAGYVGEQFDGQIAVYASSGAPEYYMHNLLRSRQTMESVGEWLVRHSGNDANFIATRVSYELNLNGPSMSVQSACSSSLLAIHLAAQSLLSGECDMALAGGSTIYVHQDRGYVYKQGEILSPDGHCRPFDAKAAGTVMSSAVGCVVLRRIEDAVRDGDRILAVIRGSAANNDGSSKVGYLAPSVSGQARVVSEAMALAGVHPDDVSYIEAHGTGTLIGDPIEVTALTEAYRASTDAKQYCAIGSLKSNIGHAGEAAGIASFIKTVLALQHRELPPSLHYETPNPQIDFASSPFFVNATLRPWTTPAGKPRVAGVTGLGAGGTNVHVLLEEAPPLAPSIASPRTQHLLALSARTPAGLDRATAALAAHLRAAPDLPLDDVAYTLLAGRKRFAHRRVVIARDAVDALAALEAPDRKRQVSHHQKGQQPPPVFFLFPGGGAQYPGMGAELYEREPAYREAFDAAMAFVEPALRTELRELAFGATAGAAAIRLESPSRALPLLFVTEYAVAMLLGSWGIEPAGMIGHSAGEYAVACVAGVMSLRDAVALASLRGRLFETLPEGGMLSVELSADEARQIAGAELSVAAVNAPSLSVLSGPTTSITDVEATLRARGIECTRIPIKVAAHSSMLDAILPEFDRFCRTVSFKAPQIPFVSSVTGLWISDAEATDPAYWVRHLRRTVQFSGGMQTILESGDVAVCEVGPGRALSSLARQNGTFAMITPTLRHAQEEASDVAFLLGAVGRLWAAGVRLDVGRLFAGESRRRVELPTYPFERQRFWIAPDPVQVGVDPRDALRKRTDISQWFYAPSWARSAPPARSAMAGETWLVFSEGSPLSHAIIGGMEEAGQRVITITAADRYTAVGAGAYTLDPSSRADFDLLGRELRDRGIVPSGILHLWAASPRPGRGGLMRRQAYDAVSDYERGLGRHFYSLVFAAQVFAADTEALRLICVSSQMQSVPGDTEQHPEKSVVLGPCKVLPREFPQVRCTSIDIALPPAAGVAQVAAHLLREVEGDSGDGEVALRGHDRWVRRFDPITLAPAESRPWLRDGGVYLLTGGLGGIALRVADHLASHAPVKLALVGRTALPAESQWDGWLATHPEDDETGRRIRAVRALRARGADVMTIAADASDVEAMRAAVARVRQHYGALHGVFHTAGLLKDEIVALRPGIAESPVLEAKMKSAIALEAAVGEMPIDFLVLFSSVASILGLPGQIDYTAANAFLDAMAQARAGRAVGRTLSIDWNAWQEVGMLASHVRRDREHAHAAGPSIAEAAGLAGSHPALASVVSDTSAGTLFRTTFRREQHWLVGEHVVRGGDALIPGTGLLEIARAALEHRRESRSIELRDVFFLEPFTVPPGDGRTMHVRIDRGDGAFVLYGQSEAETFVVGSARYVDAAPGARIDVEAIRARCTTPGAVIDGQLVQHFMDFGPRWGCARRLDLGQGEALVSIELPAAFRADLESFRLHPAMLDLATGGAQALVPGFNPNTAFYVPFSYGRVLLRRGLPERVFSHVRLRDDAPKDSIIFDVTIADERGEEVAAIEGFMMRLVDGSFVHEGARPPARTAAAERRPETPSEVALRQGMTSREGLDALDRMMAVECSPQVVACTLPLQPWLSQLTHDAAQSLHAGADENSGPVFTRPNVSAAFAPPRDDIERELAALWKGLLGVAEVGVNDDFFELGGQSLVAVRLFQRISKKFGVELPLSTLFQAPSIAECAVVLREALGLPAPGAESDAAVMDGAATMAVERPARAAFKFLVEVQRGRPDHVPFFCIHGAGGNVLNFRDLAQAMHADQPFYGLQALGVDGVSQPHGSVEEMAEAYLAEIRVRQPEGPYLLGGYSGGGIVAFEIARRLTAVGQPVGLLAFIDTFLPEHAMPDTLATRLKRVRREGLGYVKGVLSRKVRAAKVAREDRALADHLARGEAVPIHLRELHLWRSFERAQGSYVLKPWDGQALLFRAELADPFFGGGGLTYGWERYVRGGVDVIVTPGTHSTLLIGPNADLVVRALNRAIEGAGHARPSHGAGPSADDLVAAPGPVARAKVVAANQKF